ncbi:MAG: AraC family transcriptional regulator [Cyanobacteria bacterium J06650_10]
MKNAAPIHDLDFHQFEGFSCYYSPAVASSDLAQTKAAAHQQVEIIVLFENAIAQLVWYSDQGNYQKTLTAGQICIIPRQQQHQLIRRQPTPLMAIRITPQLIVEATHQTLRTPQWSFQGEYGIQDETVLSLAKALRHWLDKEGEIAKVYRKSLVKLLAVHLIANYAQADFKQEGDLKFQEDGKLTPVLEYIHNHLDQELKISDLAKRTKLSQSHFCRVFKKAMGLSPYRYIIYRRIAKAKTLLVDTTLSLADISFQCGFYDQSHFILQFRRFTGTTPKAYREKDVIAKKASEIDIYSA